jgi:hypothetical protein
VNGAVVVVDDGIRPLPKVEGVETTVVWIERRWVRRQEYPLWWQSLREYEDSLMK